jgi:chorismate mutase
LNQKPSIDALRKEMRDTTIEIMRLVGKRLALAKKIAETKLQEDLPMEDLEVERRLRITISETCKVYGVDLKFGLKLLNMLVEEAKRIQNKERKKWLRKKGG